MPKISALPEMTVPEPDDYLAIVDRDGVVTKRINLSDLTGYPEYGWTSAAETWSYSAWNSTTRIGVITVPTDATTKYVAGMRIKITQATGGTKYGIIHAVTATTLTVFFPSGTTFTNEAITDPYFSSVKVPYGFDPDPTIWTLEVSLSTASTFTLSAGVWDDAEGINLTLGVGKWELSAMCGVYFYAAGNETGLAVQVALSTSTSSRSDADLEQYGGYSDNTSNRKNVRNSYTFLKNISIASGTSTYYIIGKCNRAGANFELESGYGNARIRALTGYL